MRKRMWGLVAVLVLMASGAGSAQEPVAVPLWEGAAPEAAGNEAADRPMITHYPAANPNGTAVLVFPGGGYARLAMDHEGVQVARWLNSLGVTSFVVQYRLGPKYKHPAMLYDAQRAIRTVRARAQQYGIDPARIGALGFSAGGHLVSTAGTHFDAGNPGAADPIERVSSRPDFLILGYPVITMRESFTHRGSRMNLLGERPDPALVWLLSNETQVTPQTPPTFLMHTTDDAGVPVENSMFFYQALRNAGVPVEMHLYETGPHGVGLAPTNPVLSTWPERARAWMAAHGWLGSTP